MNTLLIPMLLIKAEFIGMLRRMLGNDVNAEQCENILLSHAASNAIKTEKARGLDKPKTKKLVSRAASGNAQELKMLLE